MTEENVAGSEYVNVTANNISIIIISVVPSGAQVVYNHLPFVPIRFHPKYVSSLQLFPASLRVDLLQLFLGLPLPLFP
jgi:hypothetical protein